MYATQPSRLVSQAAATAMRANAGRNPNHPRLRHTDPFDPTERRVCLAILSVRKQGGAWAQGKCVTLTECTLLDIHIYIYYILYTLKRVLFHICISYIIYNTYIYIYIYII